MDQGLIFHAGGPHDPPQFHSMPPITGPLDTNVSLLPCRQPTAAPPPLGTQRAKTFYRPEASKLAVAGVNTMSLSIPGGEGEKSLCLCRGKKEAQALADQMGQSAYLGVRLRFQDLNLMIIAS